MADSTDTAQRVKQVTADVLKVDMGRITDQARFVEDLGAESMQSIELIAAYEEEFDIEMEEEAAIAVKNVGDAISFIQKVIDEQS